MNRRDFLIAGTAFLGGCGSDGLARRIEALEYQGQLAEQRSRNIRRIYNELPNHVYIVDIVSKLKNDGRSSKDKGAGVVIDGKYLTVSHILIPSWIFKHRYSSIKIPIEFSDQKTSLNGKKLEKIVDDSESEVVVFKLPNGLKLPNFPAEPSNEVELGQEVYIIGNPDLRGFNIRRASVSDLDGLDKLEGEEDSFMNRRSVFGVDTNFIFGDSGCPVVSSDFKLLGLAAFDISSLGLPGVGYVQRIGEFLKHIK